MSNLVTFSSTAYVDNATTPTTRFTTFSLDAGSSQFLTAVRNRVVSGRPAALTFQGSNLLAAAPSLEAVEARGVDGPRANLGGYVEALAREGELVTLAMTLADGTEIAETGIVTDLTVTVGPNGGLAQSIDLVFHKVDRLVHLDGSLTLSAQPEPVAETVTPPAAFDWAPSFTISRDVNGAYSTDFDPSAYVVNGTRYHVAPGGTGDGSSAGSPLATVREAIAASIAAGDAATEVVLAPGRYDGVAWGYTSAGRALSLTCPSGTAILTNQLPLTWTAHNADVWQAPDPVSPATTRLELLDATRVWDHANPDSDGLAQRLASVASLAACEATPGSAYYDAGAGTLYVHTFDARQPDSNIYAPCAEAAGLHNSGGDLYMENITVWGGIAGLGIRTEAGDTSVLVNVKSLYTGEGTQGFILTGDGFIALIDGEVGQAGQDGVDYTDNLKALEVGMRARACGYSSTGANNCTTAHNNVRVIRLNGDYSGAQDRTLHDVHQSHSWNIACAIAASKGHAATSFSVGAGFETIASESCRVWLEACTVQGPGYVDEDDAVLYTRDTTLASMELGSPTPY